MALFKNEKQRRAFFAKNYPNKSDNWLGKNLPDNLLTLSKEGLNSAMKLKGITKKDLATEQDFKKGNSRLIPLNPFSTDLDNILVKKFIGLKISEIG